MQRTSNEMKAQKALQQLDGKMQKFGFRSYLELQALVESIFDPKAPCYKKAMLIREAATLYGMYYSGVRNDRDVPKLTVLGNALVAVLREDGYVISPCIQTPQEHKLLGSTVWPAVQMQKPLILAHHEIITVDWASKGKAQEFIVGATSEITQRGFDRIFMLEDGKSIDISTEYWQPKFIATRKDGLLSIWVKPKLGLEKVKVARKLLLCHQVSGSVFKDAGSMPNEIFMSIEPLGPDGNAVRDPRLVDVEKLAKLAKEDPRLDRFSHEGILEQCCLKNELRDEYRLKT